jgi:hypothetical protein
MKLKSISNALTSRAGRQILKVQKHSPALLFGAGVVGVIGTVVLASRATLKLEETLHYIQNDMTRVQSATTASEGHHAYTEQDRQRDMAVLRVKGIVSVGKLYAPAVALGAVSIAALTGSHVILNRRNVALTAAYAAIEKGFREYRERVVGAYGEDKDREFRYGVVKQQIVEETENGPVTKTVKRVDMNAAPSVYARFFDESSSSWSKEPTYNQVFIQCQQNWANDMLKARGHLFLNEVYDMLGIPRTKEGQIVGWVLNGEGDNYVDFGVFRGKEAFMGQQFVNGVERSVLLDFNVDGVVFDKI